MRHPFPWIAQHGDSQNRVFDAENNAVATCRSPEVAKFLAEAAREFNDSTESTPADYADPGDEG